MSQLGLTLFLIGLVFLVASFYIYNRSDTTAHRSTYELINQCKKDYNTLNGLLTSNIQSVTSYNHRIENLKMCAEKVRVDLEDLGGQVRALRLANDETREKQIQLQEKLSNKRPVIKISEPIQFQIVEKKKGLGIRALVKDKK